MHAAQARELLLDLTALPTAAGREGAAVRFVRGWARARPRIRLDEDAAGNLTLRSVQEPGGGVQPIYLAAHLDHPAAVVDAVDPTEPRRVTACFRGGVGIGYMRGAAVRLHPAAGGASTRGRVVAAEQAEAPAPDPGGRRPWERPDPELTLSFDRDPGATPGDVVTWDLGGAVVEGDRVSAPACDDLAGVAAALATLDAVSTRRGGGPDAAPLRVLLTRAEEVGFVGAIAACKAGTLPADARIVVVEATHHSPEAPLGGGPIVRVGDRSSTFDPALTRSLGDVAAELAEEAEADPERPAFAWQRKLMAGGTCEATAFPAYGFAAACLCLPMAHYHNMSDEATDALAREEVSLGDFEGLLRLLERLPERLGRAPGGSDLRERLDALHDHLARLLKPIEQEPERTEPRPSMP